MDSIKTQGNEIIDIKVMQQSKRARVTIELTENDTKVLAGSLMAWRANSLLFDSEFKPSEIQGNDNGTEIPKPKKESSIYSRFRLKCIEYSGQDYYDRLKAHLGVQHLEELEKTMSESMVQDVLYLQYEWITSKQVHTELYYFSERLSNKDSAYNKWEELFDTFNNPTK